MSGFEAKKKVIKAEILENVEIAKGIFRMILDAKEVTSTAKAGQFVNLYLNNKSMLLPRPISICEIKDNQITLIYGVVGQGTKELSEYGLGEFINVSTANGNGFDLHVLEDNLLNNNKNLKTIVLAGGGIGVPPMLELAKALRKHAVKEKKTEADQLKLVAVIGFKEEPFLEKELSLYCDEVYVATDNGSAGFRGNIVELMKTKKLEADYYFACGPKVMLKSLSDYCKELKREGHPDGVPVQVSMEERMGCGYGACVGCTCKTKENAAGSNVETTITLKKVCKDGPVFLGSEVAWDE